MFLYSKLYITFAYNVTLYFIKILILKIHFLFLQLLGNGVMAVLTFSEAGKISSIVGPIGWGLALMVAIAVTGGVSGTKVLQCIKSHFYFQNHILLLIILKPIIRKQVNFFINVKRLLELKTVFTFVLQPSLNFL